MRAVADSFQRSIEQLFEHPKLGLLNFVPRPDRPELGDEQQSFVESRDRVSFLVKSNACLGGWQEITDPVTGLTQRVDEIAGPFHVWSCSPTGDIIIGLAGRPFVKGFADVFEVQLSSGQHFFASAAHRVLTPIGWVALKSLSVGDPIVSAQMLAPPATEEVPALNDSPVKVVPQCVRITSIIPIRQCEIWDFQVFPYHNYVAGGAVHHNSGGTTSAAAKCANFLLRRQPPPRFDTPFWIISNKKSQCMDCCWKEKLYGNGFINDCEIDWNRVQWDSLAGKRPAVVPLKSWPVSRGGHKERNWAIEFKSYEEGRSMMQAASIGGFWFSEQFPWSLFTEVLRGCRDYMFPGGQFCEFTPISRELSVRMQQLMNDPPAGWKIYSGSIEANRENLAPGFIEDFTASIPEEQRDTRLRGKLASYQGGIYPGFNPALGGHVWPDDAFLFPPGIKHFRAVDWGSSESHLQTCLWGYKDGAGDWWIYDEYFSGSQMRTQLDHAIEIMARSIAWGWPEPPQLVQQTLLYRHLRQAVRKRLEELDWLRPCNMNGDGSRAEEFGYCYCDPSRPTEMRDFAKYGIATAPAYNAVLPGIEIVKAKFLLHPATNKPKIRIRATCKKLIEQLQSYHWEQPSTHGEMDFGSYRTPPAKPFKAADDLCFPAGQLVDTPAGRVPIEQVKVGDLVFTHLGVSRVLGAGLTGWSRVGVVNFSDERTITCTAKHPLAISGGFVAASAIAGRQVYVMEPLRWRFTKEKPSRELAGTVEHTPERPAALTTYNALALIAKDNSQLTVTQRRSIAPRNVRKLLALDFVPLPSRVPVYNLSTTDGTFFVNGVLVHNCDTIRYLCASVEKLSTEDPMTSQNGRASEPPRKSILVDARTVGGRRIGA